MKQLISAAVAALFLAVTFSAPARTADPSSVIRVADDTKKEVKKKKETKKKKQDGGAGKKDS